MILKKIKRRDFLKTTVVGGVGLNWLNYFEKVLRG